MADLYALTACHCQACLPTHGTMAHERSAALYATAEYVQRWGYTDHALRTMGIRRERQPAQEA